MSGGSMNYLCFKVQDAEFELSSPERRAFKKHLEKVANALHAIEWVDSSDKAQGDENQPILDCIGDKAVLEELISEAREVSIKLQQRIDKLSEEENNND